MSPTSFFLEGRTLGFFCKNKALKSGLHTRKAATRVALNASWAVLGAAGEGLGTVPEAFSVVLRHLDGVLSILFLSNKATLTICYLIVISKSI